MQLVQGTMADNNQTNQAMDKSTSNPQPINDQPKGLDIAHFVMYGQPGNIANGETEENDGEYERVQPGNWKHKPFKKSASAEWDLSLDIRTLRKLAKGFRPREMEGELVP
jgi:hypothetical protein